MASLLHVLIDIAMQMYLYVSISAARGLSTQDCQGCKLAMPFNVVDHDPTWCA